MTPDPASSPGDCGSREPARLDFSASMDLAPGQASSHWLRIALSVSLHARHNKRLEMLSILDPCPSFQRGRVSACVFGRLDGGADRAYQLWSLTRGSPLAQVVTRDIEFFATSRGRDPIGQRAALRHSQDDLFHTLLGLFSVKTKVYNPQLDLLHVTP